MNQSTITSLTLSTVVCPIISLDVAAATLSLSRQRVQGLIEDGQIRYAWDVGRRRRRNFIRIFAQSVIEYQNRLPDIVGSHAEVLRKLFPVLKGNPTAAELEKLFACDARTILDLAHDGRIKMVTKCRPGRGGSPRLGRASLFRFLEDRRLC